MRDKKIIKAASLSSDRPELSRGEDGLPLTQGISPSRPRISWVLSSAVQLWLRSQVESVSELEVKIDGGGRQILQGIIPQVCIGGSGIIYQGLHLTTLNLKGSGIRVNLLDILRGKSLQLQDPLQVVAQLHLTETDLNASMRSPLIGDALTQFFLPPLTTAFPGESPPTLIWKGAALSFTEALLTLEGHLHDPDQEPQPFWLRTGLQIVNAQDLYFVNPTLEIPTQSRVLPLESVILPLGPDVAISDLSFTETGLLCQGQLTVLP
jgi:hypothetical protein